MINRTRRRFVLFTVSIVLVLCAVTTLGAYAFLYGNFKAQTETLLHSLVKDVKPPRNEKNEYALKIKSVRVLFKYDEQTKTLLLDNSAAQYDPEYYQRAEINAMVEKAFNAYLDSGAADGDTDGIFYKIAEAESPLTFRDGEAYVFEYVFAALDRTADIDAVRKNVSVVAFALLIFLAVITAFVIFASKKIVKPIETALKKQKEFISDASHELKTPMTVISANLDVIENESGKSEWIANIKEQIERMNGLITNMLSLAKTDETTEKGEPALFSLSDAANTSLLPFEAVAYEKRRKIKFEIAENLEVYGDENSFRKIAAILIDNAIKYADGRGLIKATAKISNARITFSVLNSGCNIKEKDKKRLFERFYRVEPDRNSEKGGSGLGLAIAKSLADANGWKLTAEIKEGEYTEFRLVF